MKRKVKAVSGLFIVVSVLGLAVLVALHHMNSKGLEIVKTEDRSIGVKMSGIHYSSTRDGKTEWVLDAKSATTFKMGEKTIFDTVRLVFFASDASTYKLTAKEGRVDESTGEVRVEGDVRVTSMDGTYSLKTERLDYSSELKSFSTDDAVSIVAGGMDVTGIGLMIDIDKGLLKIDKEIRAVLNDAL